METKSGLVGHIDRIVQDESYTDLIAGFIEQARRDIAGRVLLPALRSFATVNTIPGAYAAPMPDDYQREAFHCFDTTTNKRVKVHRSFNLLSGKHPNDINKDGSLYGVTVEPAKAPQEAKGTITLTGLPVADETFVIGSQTFTFKAARVNAGEVEIGADSEACASNIVTAITADISSEVTAIASGSTVVVSSVDKTAAANDTVFTESATNMSVDGSGTLGGTQLGVKTAWLRYARSPSSAHALRIHYFALPTAFTGDNDSPYELPEHLQYKLLINSVVFECFFEIYSEDDQKIPDRWELRKEQAINELELFIGPYAREPEPIEDSMEWDSFIEGD